jgi:hypothetical protein
VVSCCHNIPQGVEAAPMLQKHKCRDQTATQVSARVKLLSH